MSNAQEEFANQLDLSPEVLPVFESTDDLASFAKKLRVLRFQTITEAATYVGIHHSNFVRYEAEGAEPPIGYLAWLAQTIASHVAPTDRETSQGHVLREINKALLQHNPATARFKNWRHLESMAARWPAKGTRKQSQRANGATAATSGGDSDESSEEAQAFLQEPRYGRWSHFQDRQRLIIVAGLLGLLLAVVGGTYAYQAWARTQTPQLPILVYEEAFVPAGLFIQGSTQQQIDYFGQLCTQAQTDLPYLCDATFFEDELPAREVTLSSYFIDRYEVTNDRFQQFVAAEGYVTTAERTGQSLVLLQGTSTITEVQGADWQHPEGPQSSIEGRGNEPVVHISYADAIAYCGWVRKRLPTEAEWEKAARGPQGWLFPWGNEWEYHRGNFVVITQEGQDYTTGPRPVGSYPDGKSAYGVEDLLGNVSEWVADWYDPDYYKNDPPDRNPKGPDSSPKDQHSKRGGGWATRAGFLHSAWRIDRPDETTNLLGFRCARDP